MVKQLDLAFAWAAVLPRASGTITVPILLHAVWDFTVFIGQADTNKVNISSAVQTWFRIIAVIAFIIGAKGMFSSPPPAAVADPQEA